jgi:flagellin-like protein
MKVSRRRGLSSIVAELLLIAVTVTIGSTLFFVASSSVGGYANGFSLLFGKSANAAQEIYIVEYAQFVTGTPRTVTLTIRNVGYIESQVAEVSFFNVTKTSGATSGTFSSSQMTTTCTKAANYATIPVANFCAITVTFNWGSGATYNVVVSTQRGNRIVVQAGA